MSSSNTAPYSIVGNLAHALKTVLIGPSPKAKEAVALEPDVEVPEISLQERQAQREKMLQDRRAAYRTALWCPEGKAALEYFDLEPDSWTYKQAVYRSNHIHHMGQFDLIPDYDDAARSRHLNYLRELYMGYPELVSEADTIVSVARSGGMLEFDTGRRHFWKVALNKLDEAPDSAA